MQCVVWIVHSFAKQLIVTLRQQLAKFPEVGRTKVASLATALKRSDLLAVCCGIAVIKPLHAGDAYVSPETTSAQKTACISCK